MSIVLSYPMIYFLNKLRRAVHAHYTKTRTLGAVVEEYALLFMQAGVFLT